MEMYCISEHFMEYIDQIKVFVGNFNIAFELVITSISPKMTFFTSSKIMQ